MTYHLREVLFEITKRCNLHCIHCGSSCTTEISDEELSPEEWTQCIDQLESMGVEKIVCSGGEPTIKSGICEIIEYLGQKNLAFGFITNGFHLPPSILQALKRAKPFSVGLSIDGMQKSHDLIRENSKSWSRLMKTISDLQNADLPICVVTTINKLNQDDLHRLAEFISMVEIQTWQLQVVMPEGRMKMRESLLLSQQDFHRVCLDILQIRASYPTIQVETADCFGPAVSGSIRSVDWMGCTAGISTLAIDARGYVTPCLSIRSGVDGGNIRDNAIQEIWDASPIFDFNRKFSVKDIGERCTDCTHNEMCRGGCASMSMASCNSYHNTPYCFTRTFADELSSNNQ